MSNPFITTAIESANTLAAKLNELAKSIKSADYAEVALHEVRDVADTTDENILAFRTYIAELDEQREAAVSQITEYIRTEVLPAEEAIDVETLTAEYKHIADQRKLVVSAAQALAGDEKLTFAEVDAIPGVRR
jgi:hypothetical protein